ncbi:adenylate kinase isoenzyme 5-like [Trematomus bernacchii]|uniref:adenylate kinase isoenzyme 5-like n=1 Tax=Trematomus bernacchii TaxID=40690 RepID=UPI00146C8F1C|nr:adenylate kinase isoenzyme 5-like [Trematomus bernacchii]
MAVDSSLLTGLLYNRPEDPVSFLKRCLTRTTELGGAGAVTWDTFIHLLGPGPPETTSTPLKTASIPPRTTITPPARPINPPHTPNNTCSPRKTPHTPNNTCTSGKTPHTPNNTCTSGKTPDAPNNTCTSGAPSAKGCPSMNLRASVPPVLPPQVFSGRSETPPGPKTAPEPLPVPPLVRSRLSIDSDSDMTESVGLLQEVSMPPLIVFIIGGPGSGKGSQAARLAQRFRFRVLSLDELLRRQLLSHASPGRKWEVISEMMGHGELGLQEDTISELRRQMIGQSEVRGFIVDGFPRDVHQALSFQEQIGSPDLVLLLLCSNQTLHCRLQQRAVQLGLLGDNSTALRRRLDSFHRDITSVSRYYNQLHLLTQVDADRLEEAVFSDLSAAVREKLLKDSSDPSDFPACISAARPHMRSLEQ